MVWSAADGELTIAYWAKTFWISRRFFSEAK
jgi:hypothetical protein